MRKRLALLLLPLVGLPVAGHVPASVNAEEASDAGQRLVLSNKPLDWSAGSRVRIVTGLCC
ncbi:MAG TPA: hypothetical protein VFM05_08840 [Candidatus Saccharimonadales bacterium]|nr:hypothetical protein [Candidatus Saccharimonadales bacterium]